MLLFYDDGDSALRYTLWNPSSIRGFQIVFEYGIRYYPKKKGINLLFKKRILRGYDDDDDDAMCL